MANDTTITVVGNLTADPELKFVSGSAAARSSHLIADAAVRIDLNGIVEASSRASTTTTTHRFDGAPPGATTPGAPPSTPEPHPAPELLEQPSAKPETFGADPGLELPPSS